jgi:RNA-directed DNA polymerase
MKHGHGQSDGGIVPEKSPNKPQGAEGMEERPPAKGNADKSPSPRTQSRSEGLYVALARIREAVRRDKRERLTSLYHHVYNPDHLREAYFRLRKDAAPGVDGVTWRQYGQNLEEHLQDLSARLARRAYRATPARRAYIDKEDGRKRPLGIPALEDKIVQYVVAQILSTIWEEEFLGFSYGFRPGRNQHNALDALSVGIEQRLVRWVLDADLRGFFDTLSHEWLVKFIQHRIGDRRIVSLIQKWLRAGVLEEGQWTRSDTGSPQGGLVSPVLANIYLHYVFDLWVHQWRKRNARGDVIVVRYADDFVMGFQHRHEAQQFQSKLDERLKQFNLELNVQKTRLIEFGRYAAQNRARQGKGKPETFNFLGFTHICGKTRKGRFVVVRQTMRKRMHRKLKEIKLELKHKMHLPIPDQGKWLASVLRGHYQYYGVPFNSRTLGRFRHQVKCVWKRSLSRRSQKGRVNWERMERLARKWLPNSHICHPYPAQRLRVRPKARAGCGNSARPDL